MAPTQIKAGEKLDLIASMEFVAAEGESKVPTFKMLANTGKPMRLRGFYDPVVVNIKGAKFDKRKTPVIMDHDTSQRVGHSTAQGIDADRNEITLNGVVSSSSQYAQEMVADAKAGFPFQCSIGATILDSTYVPEGKSAKVNGQEFTGPLIVANKVRIREVSFTVLGADNDTEVDVAASQQGNTMNPFEEFCASLGLDPKELTEEQTAKIKAKLEKPAKVPDDDDEDDEDDDETAVSRRRQVLAKDEERVDAITALAVQYKDSINTEHSFTVEDDDGEKKVKGLNKFKAAAIQSDMTANEFELRLMRASRATDTNQPGIISHNNNLESEVLEAYVARAYQLAPGKNRWVANCGGNPTLRGEVPANCQGREYGLEAYYKPEVLEKSHDKKYKGLESIQALLEVQVRAAGRHFSGMDRGGTELLAASVDAYQFIRGSGFSTLNVPNILENLMHKFALAAFDGQDQTWRAICGRKSLNDFRPHNMYRLNFQGHFRQVDQQGQLKHISLTDSKYTVQANTFGAMITVDRKTMRNDDLGMVLQKAAGLGMLGAMRIEQTVYALLLSNPGAFFSSTLGNLISGSTSALNQTGASTPATPAGLDQARRAFRNLTINGYPIGVSPSILLGGTSMETQMYQIWAQETFAVAGVSGSVNWLLNKNEFQGLYRPVVTPYLNNTSLTDDEGNSFSGQSNTQWYLFCNPALPQGSAIVIGFLDGRDQPYFDQADTQFNVPGGIQFRAYLDWGVNMNVYQLALKSAGA